MKTVGGFIDNGYQYKEVSNDSWYMPMTGHRKRKVDINLKPLSDWETISRYEYEEASDRADRRNQ